MDEQERSRISGEVYRQLQEADEKCIRSLEGVIRDYVHTCLDAGSYSPKYPDVDIANNAVRNGLIRHLKENKKPSLYFKEHIKRFKDYISKELIPYFYKVSTAYLNGSPIIPVTPAALTAAGVILCEGLNGSERSWCNTVNLRITAAISVR